MKWGRKRQKLRHDPIAQARQALGFALDAWQEDALAGDYDRLLLMCHRQAGKSTIAGAIANDMAIRQRDRLILVISPSLRQSGELFRKVRGQLDNIQDRPTLVEDNKLSCTFENGSRIVSLPGSEDTIRGYSSVNLIIEDEAARVEDALHYSVLPMLMISKGKLIQMTTPFGKRGHFYEEWENGGESWKRIKFPASQNVRIDTDYLADMRKIMGDWWYMQEFECEFMDPVDTLFNYDTIMSAFDSTVQPLFVDDEESGIKPLFDDVLFGS